MEVIQGKNTRKQPEISKTIKCPVKCDMMLDGVEA